MSSHDGGGVSPDLHTLSGAYAVNALPEDERAVFEAHLHVCDACPQEVAELVATAARLGAAQEAPPPARMRAAVLEGLSDVRQEAPAPVPTDDGEGPRRPRPRWVTELLAPAAAVVVIALLGLAVIVAQLNARIDQLEAATAQVTEVIAAPDARTFDLEGPSGHARVVLAESLGEAVFLADGMRPTGPEHVYALWLIGDDGPIPAGAFDVDERGRVTRVVTGDLTTVTAIAVTLEPAGGPLVEPTTDPVMVIEVTA